MMVLLGAADLYINSSPSGIRAKFPFWGVYIYVDFNLENHKTTKRVNVMKPYEIIFLNINFNIYKTV